MKRIISIYGVAIGIIWSVLTYLVMFNHIGFALTSALSYGLLLIVFVIASMAYRNKSLSRVSFGEYFKLNAGLSVVSVLINLVMTIAITLTIADAEKIDLIDRSVQMQLELYESIGFSDGTIDAMVDVLYERAEKTLDVRYQILDHIMLLFGVLIIALIISALLSKVLKKKRAEPG